MATPQLKSYEQWLGELLNEYTDKTGINDVNTGSLSLSFFEVMAMALARGSGDSLQILRDMSVDRAAGEVLQRIAKDEGLRELPARVASGTVTIQDSSFTKISTKVYAGTKAPNIGTVTLPVSDASSFPASGSIYIGRGTPNVEGPIAYSAKTQVGSYWTLTLVTPTAKFHNINESVVLSQGGVRNIPADTLVKSPSSGVNPDINFTTTQAAVILDGEVEVAGVPVSCTETGTIGNVPINGIKEFGSAPFSGATVFNPSPFKTGRDTETDEELRIRIKRARLSKGLGTANAVKNSVYGATPSDENTSVTSAEIVTNSNGTFLYIDDGMGYEQKTQGVGLEIIVDSAIGGEKNLQLETGGRQTSIAKAFIASTLKAPFDVAGTDRLAIKVGGIVTEHTFSTSDFISPGGATAYEIVASVNANSSLNFEASTTDGGTGVSFSAKAEENEDIQAVAVTAGRNVATLVGLPSNEVKTLRLFKNKIPISKDGSSALVVTENQAEWSPAIVDGDTLILSVDNTASITYVINNADFIAEGTYPSVSASNSLQSWVNVLNAKLTGVTAAIVGEQISLTSNLGASDRAAVEIDPTSTLVVKNMFSASLGLSATGKSADYKFSRNTGQIRLNQALVKGDQLTAGSEDTEARIESEQILGGTLTLANDAYVWMLADDNDAQIVNTGVVANTLIEVAKPSANIVRYISAVPSAFDNVQVGDYVIVWSEELSSANRLEARVNAKTSTQIDIKVTAAEYAAAVAESGILYQEGLVVVRTTKVPQKLKVTSGTKSVNDIAAELNEQTSSLEFSVIDDEIIVVNTPTRSSDGGVLIVTSDEEGKNLGFNSGDSDESKESLLAFYESGYKEGDFPLFVHSDFSSEASASPPDSYVSNVNSTLNPSSVNLDPNAIVTQLQPYGTILDALSPSEKAILNNYSGSTLTLAEHKLIKRLRNLDRYFFANPLDLGHQDEAVVILDSNATDKTFSVPFYRTAKTNATFGVSATGFNAYDLEAGPTAPFTNFFPSDFRFDNFKVLMRAKKVINPSATEDAILYRAKQYGRSGERINIGYIYPTAPNNDITHTAIVDENINLRIALKSGAPVLTTIDGTTEWDVTITPNTPVAGVDQVTYTYTGTGTAPGLGGLSGGEYVTISQGSELSKLNTGTFRVSDEIGFTPTANSFTVVRKNNEAIAESDKATSVANVFTFFLAQNTTAQDVVDYVENSVLTNLIDATLVDDSGTSGAGVIDRSTAEENNFSIDSYSLLDGINWILSSDLLASPQFVLKRNLSLPSDTGYAFNLGEEVRLVPTTAEQAVRLANILAVSGLTTVGSAKLVARDGKIELATQLLGGTGAIQVVGGAANGVSVPVIGNSALIDNAYAKTAIAAANINGLHSDQWVKLSASNKQEKETLFKSSASIAISSDDPVVGKSTINISGRLITDRHFGRPRHHIRTEGRTFKVEKQGVLTCISWDGSGTQPFFSKALEINAGSGTLNVEKVTGTSEAIYYIQTGTVNFTEAQIGMLLTVSCPGLEFGENNGVFLITGVSDDGKSIRVLNPDAVNEFSYATVTITNNAAITGDEFVVGGTSLIAGVDFAVGATAADTAANLASAISALPGVVASSDLNVVTITAITANASISLVYNDLGGGGGASVSGATLVGRSYGFADFAVTGSVSEGDNVIISSPFNVLNRGKFRVIRKYENSIYIENESSVEETVSLSANSVSLGFDGTTEFNVSNVDNYMRLTWNGTGTEPTLGLARVGDEVEFGTDFDPDNQGRFMVRKAETKKPEICRATLVAGGLISSGNYWLLNAANDTTEYYVWYNVDGGGGDPALVGKTGIQVNIASSASASSVAASTQAAIDALADFSATVSGAEVTVTTAGFANATDASDGTMPLAFQVETLQQGQRTFLEVINPKVVAEAGILITDVLTCHRPQILFYEYEATVAGDVFVVSNDFLGSDNQGRWTVDSVLDEDTIVVVGTMSEVETVALGSDVDNLLVEEEIAYVGYKKIRLISIDPNAITRGVIVFDSEEQYNKINDVGIVQISAVGKLSFDTTIKNGLDSYRYHTGLIAEANRVVYGDPRDSTTYPGSGAAGAEIFIREPLTRRIQLAIDVRIETGIPFAQIVEQVRTNVSALINSNDIGRSIAISDIVETVNIIPGVRAVAISSPLYNSANDTIAIASSEKSRIINPVDDISVDQIS